MLNFFMGEYIEDYSKLEKIVKELREKGKKVVLAGGCFDIVHPGHKYFFEQAKKYGDILMINVANDKKVREYKGETRPIQPQEYRAQIISAFGVVDYVTVHPSLNCPTTELAVFIKPHFFIKERGMLTKEELKKLKIILGDKIKLRTINKESYKMSTTEIMSNYVKKLYLSLNNLKKRNQLKYLKKFLPYLHDSHNNPPVTDL